MSRLARFAVALTLAVWLVPTRVESSTIRFEAGETRKLSGPLAGAGDLRYGAGPWLYLAAPHEGVFKIEAARGDIGPPIKLLGARNGAGELWLTSRIGRSERATAVAAAAFQGFGLGAEFTGEPVRFGLEGIEDLDLQGSRVAVTGLMRSETEGAFAPDGAVAWVLDLAAAAKELRPVAWAFTGPGASAFNRCLFFEISAIRFLPDGTLMFVPGAEPGAFLLDPSSGFKTTASWDLAGLQIGADCTFGDADHIRFARDPTARWAWLNRFETVEEVLPLRPGPVLVTRRASSSGTDFRAVHLLPEGKVRIESLPIRSTSPLAHVRGDVRGDEVALVVYEVDIQGLANAELRFLRVVEDK